jgi:hypothetical protein
MSGCYSSYTLGLRGIQEASSINIYVKGIILLMKELASLGNDPFVSTLQQLCKAATVRACIHAVTSTEAKIALTTMTAHSPKTMMSAMEPLLSKAQCSQIACVRYSPGPVNPRCYAQVSWGFASFLPFRRTRSHFRPAALLYQSRLDPLPNSLRLLIFPTFILTLSTQLEQTPTARNQCVAGNRPENYMSCPKSRPVVGC